MRLCATRPRPRPRQGQTRVKKKKEVEKQRRSVALSATIPFTPGIRWGHRMAFNHRYSQTSECHLGIKIIKEERRRWRRHPGGLLKHAGQHSQTNTAYRWPGRAWRATLPGLLLNFFKLRLKRCWGRLDEDAQERCIFFQFWMHYITVKGVFSCIATKLQISVQLRKTWPSLLPRSRFKVGVRFSDSSLGVFGHVRCFASVRLNLQVKPELRQKCQLWPTASGCSAQGGVIKAKWVSYGGYRGGRRTWTHRADGKTRLRK